MFAKVFTQILDSSLAEDYQTRHVFEDLLKLCDFNGVVDMTHEAIARRTNVPLEIVQRGITELEKADLRSRNPEFEGRRIVRLDQHRDWGWKIVNFGKYREIRTQAEKSQAHGYDSSRRGYIYYAVDDPEKPVEIKIGFSANPWARILELRTTRPKIRIVATEHGTKLEETALHEKFHIFQVSGEWFRFEGELKTHVESLIETNRSSDRSSERSDDSDRSPIQRQKQKQRQIDIVNRVDGKASYSFRALAAANLIISNSSSWHYDNCKVQITELSSRSLASVIEPFIENFSNDKLLKAWHEAVRIAHSATVDGLARNPTAYAIQCFKEQLKTKLC